MRKFILDKLVTTVHFITKDEFKRFNDELIEVFHVLEDSRIGYYYEMTIGKSIKDYHYNVHWGKGEGAIYCGYKHNTKEEHAEYYDMKIEFNPQKVVWTDDGAEEQHAYFFDIYRKHFKSNKKTFKMFDLALDVPLPKNSILVKSMTGKEEDRYKGTRYWGTRSRNGYLKVYDKKKERKVAGVSVNHQDFTRIEYTYVNQEGLEYSELKTFDIDLSSKFLISLMNDIEGKECTAEVQSYIFAIKEGFMREKDFTRTNRKKIEAYMRASQPLNLNEIYKNSRNDIIELIEKFFY